MAKVDLASLLVRLEAETAEFKSELKKSRGMLSRLKREAKSTGRGMRTASGGAKAFSRSLRRLAAAAAAYASLRGLGNAIKSSLDFADAISKSSHILGLGVHELQIYRVAADEAAVGPQTLDKALMQLAQASVDATHGIGEAKGVLDSLGTSLQTGSGPNAQMRDLGAIFEDVLKGVAALPNPTERANAALRIFGRRGAGVLNMAENFDALKAHLEAAGVALDADVVARAVRAKDRLTELATATKVKLMPAMIDLAPALADALEALPPMATYFAQLVTDFRDFFEISKAGKMRAAQEDLVASLDAYQAAVQKFQTAVALPLGPLRDRVEGALLRSIEEAESRYNAAKAALSELENAPVIVAGGGQGDQLAGLREQAAAIRETVKPALETYVEQIRLYNVMAEKHLLSPAELVRAQELAAAAFDRATKSAKETTTTGQELAQSLGGEAATAVNTFAATLASALSGGEADFKTFAAAVIGDIGRIITRLMILSALRPLAGKIFGADSGITKALGGATGNAQGNAFVGGRIQALANGGILDQPTYFGLANGSIAVAGEVPTQSEAVLPLTRTHSGRLGVAAVGGGGFAPTVNISVDASGQREPQEIGEAVASETRRQLAELWNLQAQNAMRYGGALNPA